MKCQKCKKNEANTHLTKVVNGKKTELYLCDECANNSQEFIDFKLSFDHDFENFFNGFLGGQYLGEKVAKGIPENKCEICGMTLDNMTKTGRPGCSNCYKIFGDFLLRPLKQIHGANKHIGKIPLRSGEGIRYANEIDRLQNDLNQAVFEQNFELAAQLRDKINELKKEEGE